MSAAKPAAPRRRRNMGTLLKAEEGSRKVGGPFEDRAIQRQNLGTGPGTHNRNLQENLAPHEFVQDLARPSDFEDRAASPRLGGASARGASRAWPRNRVRAS